MHGSRNFIIESSSVGNEVAKCLLLNLMPVPHCVIFLLFFQLLSSLILSTAVRSPENRPPHKGG